MIFTARCTDDRVSNRKMCGFKLEKGRLYEVVGIRKQIVRTRFHDINTRPLEFAVSERPDVFFFARRFEPVGEIIINLPDDIEYIWI